MADTGKQPADLDAAARRPRTGIVAEFLALLRYNKKWWLLPILVILFLLGLLAVLGGSPLAPFIYTLF